MVFHLPTLLLRPRLWMQQIASEYHAQGLGELSVQEVPAWEVFISGLDPRNPIYPFKTFFESKGIGSLPPHDFEVTMREWEAAGVTMPNMDSYTDVEVQKMVAWLKANGHIN